MRYLILLTCLALTAGQKSRKAGDPLGNLPSNAEVLTRFGERADIAPDNEHIAFMTKSFGDAMTIDLETRSIRCLTCSVPGAVFLRVMHLVSGDYILIGPDHFEDIHVSRSRDNELWFLGKEPGSKPVKLDQKMSEGAAISKKSLKIAYSLTPSQTPGMKEGTSQLVVAEVDLAGPKPQLVNKTVVYESPDRNCVIEPQDFYDNDNNLTFSCYRPQGLASVMSIDLQTHKTTALLDTDGYNEVEGIFPDGLYTCVESDKQCEELGGERGSGNIDVWKLKMDGTGKDFERLTRFNDYIGGKASNPVVSTDGRFMAFQTAKTTDPAGVGYGLLIWWFRR